MIDEALRTAIRELADRQIAIREICRLVRVSRNTVRRVLRDHRHQREPTPIGADLQQLLQTLYPRCEGNVARMRQILHEDYQRDIPYTTLARWVRDAGLRPTPRRVGTYHFGPGEEMQHDTSPMRVHIGGKPVATQCAALTLAYSRRLYMQFLPHFTRFEAKSFLSEALTFMGGSAPRCVIDNTSVIVVGGSGADAIFAPEMVAFAEAFGTAFLAHRIQDPDRKARIERPFHYIQHNFLVAREFRDWDDLNEQARRWCETVANATIKRALGMTPQAAYLIERPRLRPLPVALPPIYQTLIRTVDSHGFIHLDTNRYSTPERFIGRRLTVLKYPRRVVLMDRHTRIAEHPRLVGQRDKRSTLPGHHEPRARAPQGPSAEERQLRGHRAVLDDYVSALRQRAPGRGVRRLQRLLALKREYPPEPFYAAVEQALAFGLFDLHRLEQMILERVAGDFFDLDND